MKDRDVKHPIQFGRLIVQVALPALLTVTTIAAPAQVGHFHGLLDDANLNDIATLGSGFVIAVGDHGVVLVSHDGGRHWQLTSVPVRGSFRSVSFVTNKIGWAVGEGTIPYSATGFGIVVSTRDGGVSWQILHGSERVREVETGEAASGSSGRSIALPPLDYVRFFGPERGVAVGASTSTGTSGVFVTDDGGVTWRAAEGEATLGWTSADFAHADLGFVVGPHATAAMVGGGRLLQPGFQFGGRRTIRDVRLAAAGRGWLVGDGALLLTSTSSGASWTTPEGLLPNETRDLFDFYTVASYRNRPPAEHGAARKRTRFIPDQAAASKPPAAADVEHVWVAGQPGSVVWHSGDGGKSWRAQVTGQSLPIHRLHFSDAQTGWAVGSYGLVMHTSDGGENWHVVRGGGKRAALMCITTRPDRIPFGVLARESGELGYRSVVILPALQSRTAETLSEPLLTRQTRLAVHTALGSASSIDWRLPVTRPGLERFPKRLITEWNKSTEGRLSVVLPLRLVTQIRTWKPDVIVVDGGSDRDALQDLVGIAVADAARTAADPRQFAVPGRLCQLRPWTVSRIYVRLENGSSGHVHFDPSEPLPRLGTSAGVLARRSRAIVDPNLREPLLTATWTCTSNERGEAQSPRAFFAGLGIAPGSASRRAIGVVAEERREAMEQLSRRQRIQSAAVARLASDPRTAESLAAELPGLLAQLPEDVAASVLTAMADEFHHVQQWKAVESILRVHVNRHPNHPSAGPAMQWLFHWWSGAEPSWRRLGQYSATQQDQRTAPRVLNVGAKQTDPFDEQARVSSVRRALDLRLADNRASRTVIDQDWAHNAMEIARRFRRKHPRLYEEPAFQMALAGWLRNRGSFAAANTIYSRLEGPWAGAARSELWTANPVGSPPPTVHVCRSVSEPPWLDGQLSDVCWQEANEVVPTSVDGNGLPAGRRTVVMMAHDQEYLYIAARISRVSGITAAPTFTDGRSHDVDLNDFDRIAVYLDTDRDYATWYTLQVDERGQTRDSCWDDQSWDPGQWHVAVAGDDQVWRVEMAIRFDQLAASAPRRGSWWAAGITRIVPGRLLEAWPTDVGALPHAEGFALLQFE